MKVLILCGVFTEEDAASIMKHSKKPVEFSANVFQEKLIQGFMNVDCDLEIISAPFVGSYPNASKILNFRASEFKQGNYNYVGFNNIWGVRNYSRYWAMKKAVKEFILSEEKEKIILVYSAHTPFIQAAQYAKNKDPNIKVCVYVPDLPQYMNLSTNKSVIYQVAKQYDIKKMFKAMKAADSFVLLTEEMRNKLPLGNKNYFVAEGIIEEVIKREPHNSFEEKLIVYTGKLDLQFGIKELMQAFMKMKDQTLRLILCGTGDCTDYVRLCEKQDKRILCTGQITPVEAKKWQEKADILINPRTNHGEYTKYSFPSKNIEYLLTGKPVVAYMLDGMPEAYEDFIYEIKNGEDPIYDMIDAISRALQENHNKQVRKYDDFCDYAANKLTAEKIASRIIDITN